MGAGGRAAHKYRTGSRKPTASITPMPGTKLRTGAPALALTPAPAAVHAHARVAAKAPPGAAEHRQSAVRAGARRHFRRRR